MEQIEKEKIQSNKGSSYKLLVEQAKLKQATSKVCISANVLTTSPSHFRKVFIATCSRTTTVFVYKIM